MRKRQLLIALALTLLPALASATVVATATGTAKSTTATGGTGGVVWTYTVNPDGTAAINQGNVGSATGAVISGDVTLPAAVDGHAVTGIAFYTRDDNGTGYGNDDFTNWRDVTAVTFPAGLTSIGEFTFSDDEVLTRVIFENPLGWASIRHIGQFAFSSNNLESSFKVDGLDLSGLGDVDIAQYIFRYRNGITGTLTLPTKTETVGNSAFSGTHAGSVNFTELTSLAGIEDWAFERNEQRASVDLSQCPSLTGIGMGAFAANSLLTSLKLPVSPSMAIANRAFMNCGLQGDLVIPSTSTSVDYAAFSNNASLRSITFTGTTLDMGGYQVFSGCTGLEYIDMGAVTTATGVNSADPTTLSRAASTAAGHMFAGLPTHTFVYLPNDGVTFNSAPGGGGLWDPSVEHWDIPNFATNGAAFLLLIEDYVDYFFPRPFKTDAVGYRDNSGNSTDYNLPTLTFQPGTTYSLYLPYAMDITGSGIGVYGPGYYDQHKPGDTTDNTLVFSKVSTFAANTPYLVRVEAGGAASTLPDIGAPKYEAGVTIQKIIPASPVGVGHSGVPGVNTTAGRPSVVDKGGVTWTLCGTSEAVDAATAASWGAWYFATDNTWYPVKGDAYSYGLRQHRAFMVPSVVGAAPSKGLLGGFDDTVTGIGNVGNNGAKETHIYNMGGQYLGKDFNALPKGVYIVNGKKVIK